MAAMAAMAMMAMMAMMPGRLLDGLIVAAVVAMQQSGRGWG